MFGAGAGCWVLGYTPAGRRPLSSELRGGCSPAKWETGQRDVYHRGGDDPRHGLPRFVGGRPPEFEAGRWCRAVLVGWYVSLMVRGQTYLKREQLGETCAKTRWNRGEKEKIRAMGWYGKSK